MNTTEKLKQNAIEYSRNKLNRIMQNGTEDNTIDQKNQNKIEQNILKTELTRTEWEEIEKKTLIEQKRVELNSYVCHSRTKYYRVENRTLQN